MSKHVISIIIIVIQLVTIEHAQTDTKSSATRDIFSRKQEEGESVGSYIDKMQKNARIVDMSGDTLQLAILNGLQSHLQNIVIQKEPDTSLFITSFTLFHIYCDNYSVLWYKLLSDAHINIS